MKSIEGKEGGSGWRVSAKQSSEAEQEEESEAAEPKSV